MNTIESLLLEESKLHPKAELTDYYKLVFQALYGPGHLIENKVSAADYLLKELESSELFDEVIIQDLSLQQLFSQANKPQHNFVKLYGAANSSKLNYCRVNLFLIKQEIVTLEGFLKAFMESAAESVEYVKEEWSEIWKNVEYFLKKSDIVTSFDDSERLHTKITNDNPISRHSERYRQLYNPHYRIIRKSHLPLLYE